MTDKIQECISFLEELAANPEMLSGLTLEQRISLLRAAGQLARPDRYDLKKRNKAIRRENRREVSHAERMARSDTGIREARKTAVFTAPARRELPEQSLRPGFLLKSPRSCYVCNQPFQELHFFYDSMCPQCAQFNYEKRFQTASLAGRTALITGSRLKIGYQASLMMLRAGAKVVATTRFPVDAAMRFAREADFSDWRDRLQIFGLDLRHTPSVEIFCAYLDKTLTGLDILINNAAQTVRRPAGFYAHLMAVENTPLLNLPADAQTLLHDMELCRRELSAAGDSRGGSETALTWRSRSPGIGLMYPAQLSQIPYTYDDSLPVQNIFPDGQLDADLQQVDLRRTNSWRLRLGEVDTLEMLEIQLVNAVAPFVLCNRLLPLMQREKTGQKHIVNVSAMEGKFHRFRKADRHPHTNMAKAALNMLTHTAASSLVKNGIFMNAVDTGWVTDEDPFELAKKKQEVHDFQPPLDIVDGAARVCDPFFDGINTGHHWSGKFLKDYRPIDW